MRKAIPLAVALSTAVALAGNAQSPVIHERIDVVVTNLHVVVTDSRGNAVEGLRAEDFAVFVDGKPTALSNFSSERIQSPTASIPKVSSDPSPSSTGVAPPSEPRHALVYLDESAFAQPVSYEFLRQSIASFADTLAVECPSCTITFYGRRVRDLHTVGVVSPAAPASSLLEAEREAQQSRAIAKRRFLELMRERDGVTYKMTLAREAKRQTSALAELLQIAGAMEGRKVLALISNIPVIIAPEVFLASESSAPEDAAGPAALSLPAPRSDAEARLMQPVNDKGSTRTDEHALITLANATGTAIYPIIASGLAELENPASAERSRSQTLSLTAVSRRLSELDTGVRFIAEATGGRMQHATNRFSVAFDHVSRDLQSYYSLGFRTTPDARHRKIEVRVRGRSDLTVRARSSLSVSTSRDWETAALQLSGAAESGGPIPIRLAIRSTTRSGRTRILELTWSLELRGALWEAREGAESTDMEIQLRSTNEAGDDSDVATVPLRIRREPGKDVPSFSDSLQVRVGAGPQELLFVLRDKLSGEVSWTTVQVK